MDNASGNVSHLLNNFESTEDAEIGNGHTKIWRAVGSSQANPDGTPAIASDALDPRATRTSRPSPPR